MNMASLKFEFASLGFESSGDFLSNATADLVQTVNVVETEGRNFGHMVINSSESRRMPRLRTTLRTTSVVLIVVSFMISVRSCDDNLLMEAWEPSQIAPVLAVFSCSQFSSVQISYTIYVSRCLITQPMTRIVAA